MSRACGILALNCESYLALKLALDSSLGLEGPGLGLGLGLEGPGLGLEGPGLGLVLGLWILALTTTLLYTVLNLLQLLYRNNHCVIVGDFS